MTASLRDLREAADRADTERRAVGGIPGVLQPPGAEQEAWSRWEAAHAALTAAHQAEADREAGQ